MIVTNSKATLGEYLFKHWIMLPENQANNENNDVPPVDRIEASLYMFRSMADIWDLRRYIPETAAFVSRLAAGRRAIDFL